MKKRCPKCGCYMMDQRKDEGLPNLKMKELYIKLSDDDNLCDFRLANMNEVVDWWLSHYEGLEHLTEDGNTSPECWYTINTILRRSFEKIKNRKVKGSE
jgi:hypothetical protein